jgi:hypothetical protein
MFINRAKSFIYLRVPKTGSTSIQHYMIDNFVDESTTHSPILDWKIKGQGIHTSVLTGGINLVHANIQDLIVNNYITEKETFDVYGVVRNPIDKFISGCYYSLSEGFNNKVKLPPNELLRLYLDDVVKTGAYLHQHEWLNKCNKIYNYENIDSMLKDIHLKFNTEYKGINYKHRSNLKEVDIVVDKDLIETIKHIYAKDFEIYNSVKQ